MACHANGMRSVTDDVRATLSGLPEYERSYAGCALCENNMMKKLLAKTRRRFEAALRKTGSSLASNPSRAFRALWTSLDSCAAASNWADQGSIPAAPQAK